MLAVSAYDLVEALGGTETCWAGADNEDINVSVRGEARRQLSRSNTRGHVMVLAFQLSRPNLHVGHGGGFPFLPSQAGNKKGRQQGFVLDGGEAGEMCSALRRDGTRKGLRRSWCSAERPRSRQTRTSGGLLLRDNARRRSHECRVGKLGSTLGQERHRGKGDKRRSAMEGLKLFFPTGVQAARGPSQVIISGPRLADLPRVSQCILLQCSMAKIHTSSQPLCLLCLVARSVVGVGPQFELGRHAP